MREFSTPMSGPLSAGVPATGNLTDDVVDNAAEAPDAVVFGRRLPGSEEWSDVTAAEFLDQVRGVAKGLVASGVAAGDRVALISRTRYEWTLVDYAIWFAGAVSVPVYETSSAAQVGHVLRDSGACAVVAEGPTHLSRIAEVRADLDELRHVWSIEDNAVDVLTRLGADIAGRRARGTTYDGHPARPRHDHLHVRHHRQPQGLHADPRQLHDRAGRRGRRARRAVRH